MDAERISSRKNKYIAHLRALASDADYRYACAEYLCDGIKLLAEALDKGARVQSVLWKDAPAELFDYASPMKNSPGPVFTLAMPEEHNAELRRAVLLENVQDPGNVGTVIRTAAALGFDSVILCGACADVYSPKTARATMGAIFRENIVRMDIAAAAEYIHSRGMKLYGAALSERAADIRTAELKDAVVAIGSEGRGLSAELLSLCDGELIIPMTPGSESFNAAIAAAIVMWEIMR